LWYFGVLFGCFFGCFGVNLQTQFDFYVCVRFYSFLWYFWVLFGCFWVFLGKSTDPIWYLHLNYYLWVYTSAGELLVPVDWNRPVMSALAIVWFISYIGAVVVDYRMVVGFTTTWAILVTGQWFSPGTPVSSINKTDQHDIAEILLKGALNTITVTY
jgi:hypothetical protein